MEIDVERLRYDLLEYFGTAMNIFPQAVVDLSIIQNASPEQLINIALNNNFDLSSYIIGKSK